MLVMTIFTALPITANAAESNSAQTGNPGGSFGTCSWTYDSETHTLTVSGTGSTGEFGGGAEKPWADYTNEIYNIVVEQGVTTLGRSVFSNMKQVDSVTLAQSVTAIDRDAFYKCTALTDVTLPETITSIGTAAFLSSGLGHITIPNTTCTIDLFALGFNEGRNFQILPKAGFTIYGYTNSNAHTYAAENSFSFIDLNSEPHYIYVDKGTAFNLSNGGQPVTEARAGELIHVAPDKMDKFTVFRAFNSDDVALDEDNWNFVMPDNGVGIYMYYDDCYPLNIDLSSGSAYITQSTYNYLLDMISKGYLSAQSKPGTDGHYIVTFADDCDILLTPNGIYTYDFDYAPCYSIELHGDYMQNPVNFIFAENQIFQSHVDLTLPEAGSAWDFSTMEAQLTLTNEDWNMGRFSITNGVWYDHWGISMFETFEGGEQYFVEFTLKPNDNYYFTLQSEAVIHVLGRDRDIYLKPLYMNNDGSIVYGNADNQIRLIGGEPHTVTVNGGYATVNDSIVTEAVPGEFVTVRILKEAVGDHRYVVMGSDSAYSDDVEVHESEAIGQFYFYMPNHDVTVGFNYDTGEQLDLEWDLYDGAVTVSDDHTQRSIALGAENVLRRTAVDIGYGGNATYYDLDGNGSYDVQKSGNVFSLMETSSLTKNITLRPLPQLTLYYPVSSITIRVKPAVKHKITVIGGVASSKRSDYANSYVITEACEGDTVYLCPKYSDIGDDSYVVQFSITAESDDVKIIDEPIPEFVMPDKDVTVTLDCDCVAQDISILDFRMTNTVTIEPVGPWVRSEAYGASMVIKLRAFNSESVANAISDYDVDGDGTMDIRLNSDTNEFTLLDTNDLPAGSYNVSLSREESWTLPVRTVIIINNKQPEPPMRGDVNFDGKVDIEDATIIGRHLAEFLNPNNGPLIDENDPDWFYRADANNDGRLNILDVTAIQRHIAEIDKLMP